LPVVTLLFPLFGWIVPMLERQRRVRIARWYGALRAAEHRCADADAAVLETEIARVRDIRRHVSELRDTPVLHLGELYHLRMHSTARSNTSSGAAPASPRRPRRRPARSPDVPETLVQPPRDVDPSGPGVRAPLGWGRANGWRKRSAPVARSRMVVVIPSGGRP
jgi:hypothetical protein